MGLTEALPLQMRQWIMPEPELTVWCVWWKDPANPDKYSAYHVQRLQMDVTLHLSIPHRFLCMTREQVDSVDTVEPPVDFPGWWQKIGLFKPDFAPGLNLYLDLDVVVTGSLDPIVEALGDDEIAMPLNWAQSGHGGCQSSVIVWRECIGTRYIYENFPPEIAHWPPVNKPGVLWGDQEYITWLRDRNVIEVRPIPEPYVKSYKYHCQGGLPNDCRVCVFHGSPKPEQVSAPWFRW